MQRFLLASLVAVLPGVVAAQAWPHAFLMTVTGQSDAQGNRWGTADVRAMPPSTPPLLGAQFSGEERRQTIRTLPGGARITEPASTGAKMWRDALGRTRLEQAVMGPTIAVPGAPAGVVFAEIVDPIAGSLYLLDASKKIAYRAKYMPLPSRPIQSPGARFEVSGALLTPGTPALPVTEQLGTKTIQGAQAQGVKTTTIYPAGSQGNSQPITTVQERWVSPQLQLTLSTHSNDPRNGESLVEIANLSLLQPDPALFRPPAGYLVKDVDPSFRMEFGTRPPGAAAAGSFSGVAQH